MKRCNPHDYVMIDTWNTGYMEKCSICDNTRMYDANDKSGMYKFIFFSIGVGIVLYIVLESLGIKI